MKNGKAAGPSHLVSEMVNTTGKLKVDMITDQVKHIIVTWVIPAEW